MTLKHSLQWRLSLMLGGTVLAMGVVATVVTFVTAFSEAKEFQDHTLRQLAVLVAQHEGPGSRDSGTLGTGDAGKNISDPEELLRVYQLPHSVPGKLFDIELTEGIQSLDTPTGLLRCYVHKDGAGNLLVITQPLEMRNELAFDSALHVFTPMILLLPLLVGMIALIVRRELTPVKKLAGHLDAQPADQPRNLPEEGVVAEIAPFIQAINRLLGRVNSLMTQQRRFIADASHELRSPLTALSLQIQNLDSVDSVDRISERVAPLKSGIERARKLAEQLLNLARVQLGESEQENIRVSDLVRQLIAEYLPLAESKHIDLGLDEEAEFEFHGSEKNLLLIMKNGLENGLKYTPDGGVVTIRLYREGNRGCCEVVDNGPGIAEDTRERLFDPFFRPAGTEQSGNGLGLAIVREAAASQGGEVTLLNNKGNSGLTFRYSQELVPENGAQGMA